MGYNFPKNPTPDYTFTPPDGPTFVWNGVGWEQHSGLGRGNAEAGSIIYLKFGDRVIKTIVVDT